MKAAKRPFRVYTRGKVHFFFSEVSLGEWLNTLSKADGLRITYQVEDSDPFHYHSYRSKICRKIDRLRYEDDDFRVEAPDGDLLSHQFLIDCIYAYFNAKKAARDAWDADYAARYPRGGKSNWHRGCYHRLIKTQNERRQNEIVAKEDGEPAARSCRMGYRLPNAWDDIPRYRDKNWKSFRKEQSKAAVLSPRALYKYGITDIEDEE